MKWRQVMSVICLLLGLTGVIWADMNDDPEVQELLASFRAMQETRRYLDDSFDGETQGTITGPVSFGPGVNADKNETDKAALFPETKEAAVYIYYGPYVPLRGRFSLDFKVDHFPPRSSRIVLFSIGTAGNSTTRLKVGLDGTVYADMSVKQQVVELFSDALDLSKWHYVEWWYGPEGSVLVLDGAIQDYSIDCSVPYAYNRSNAFYLGDMPYWHVSKSKGYFSAGDSFVGLTDNLQLIRLQPGGAE